MAAPAAVEQAALTGRVADAAGQPLAGATIRTIDGRGAPGSRNVSDEDGFYRIALPVGTHTVAVSAPNFAEARRTIAVVPGSGARLDVTLQLAANATVVVTARDTFRNVAELPTPSENLVGVANAASEGAVTGRQIEARPIMRAGEVLESVPGLIISQHSGEGKANQYYLRGFNLDHGTDFSTTVAGIPVNLPTHAHGQGYTDLNFLIPELVTGVQFRKGPYFARDGDFSAAGSAAINYANVLAGPQASLSYGQDGWGRVFAAASPRVGGGHLLMAIELNRNDGPWQMPDGYRRINTVARYSRGGSQNAWSISALAYRADWKATDQVPARAIESGLLGRFGSADDSSGGATARYSVVGEFQRTAGGGLTRGTAFVSRYRLNLFSNFTYALDNPERGDQFEQADRRWIGGGRVSHTRRTTWAGRIGEWTTGAEVRHDAIPLVGLYRTERRVRWATTRQDDVSQSSAGVFADHDMRWLAWLRTTAGLRVDAYRFRVDADLAQNSGSATSQLVSPKAGAIFGPWRATEFYVNAGTGFHSNDARGSTISIDPATGDPAERVTPLVRAKGAELGVRTVALPRLQSTLAVWTLALDSELLFVGDAGTTDAGRPSRRTGVEWTNFYRLSDAVTIDADLAWSRSRFSDVDEAGQSIPGAAGFVAAAGVTVDRTRGWFGSARLRLFGPRPLIEDDSIRSRATRLLNAQVGYHLTSRTHVLVDVFNVLDEKASDVDYFYRSRLSGEPMEGVDGLHTHPTLPRSARLILRFKF